MALLSANEFRDVPLPAGANISVSAGANISSAGLRHFAKLESMNLLDDYSIDDY